MSKSAVVGTQRPLTTAIYVLCVAIALIFAGTNLGILQMAGGQADAVRDRLERRLLQDEFSHQIEAAARDQAQISHWDNAVNAFSDRISLDFVENEMADWLWTDFGLRVSIVVDVTNTAVVSVLEDDVVPAHEVQPYLADSIDLIEAARKKFEIAKVKVNNGYTIVGEQLIKETPIYAADVRLLDGQLGVAVAQAIVPDDVAMLTHAEPKILLTFKPIAPTNLVEIGEHLGLEGLKFVEEGSNLPQGVSSLEVASLSGQQPLVFQWSSVAPSAAVWSGTLPLLIGLFLTVVSVLFVLARRYAKALDALQNSEAENRYRAQHDALTGLPNRQQFDFVLDEAINAQSETPCAVACLDLDNFKAVNDTFGHQAGDAVIQTTADRIAKTVGGAGLAARLGGDEFIILFSEYTSREHLHGVCNSLISRLSEDISFEGGKAQVGASIGIAWAGQDGETVKELVRSADEALYRAKELGRGMTCLAGEDHPSGCVPPLTRARSGRKLVA